MNSFIRSSATKSEHRRSRNGSAYSLKFNSKLEAHRSWTASCGGAFRHEEGVQESAIVEQVLPKDAQRQTIVPLQADVVIEHRNYVGFTVVKRSDTSSFVGFFTLLVINGGVARLTAPFEVSLCRHGELILGYKIELIAHLISCRRRAACA
jgi:hypothetical protein